MSIKGRLTIWFTLLFGLLVIALSLAAYVMVRAEAYSRLDAALQVAVGATAMSADHEMDEHAKKADGEADLQAVLSDSGTAILRKTQILVRDGNRTVAYKPGEQGPDLRKLRGDQWRDGARIAGLRIASRRLRVEKFNTTYSIVSAQPLASALAYEETVRLSLLVTVPGGLFLAGVGGYLLARRSLGPLNQFEAVIDGIRSTDLSARVTCASGASEITSLGSHFNALLSRLEEAFTLQRRFMADASHQIRTPLTVALAAAQLTNSDESATLEDYRAALRKVEKQMLQLRRILADMFFLSQADLARLQVEQKEVYLDDVVEEAASGALELLRQKQQTLTMNALPDARCLGDRDLLTQALLILLDNAVKFTSQGGLIEILLSARGRDWTCAVMDNGIGIPGEHKARIFERFFQASVPEGKAERESAGLGLAIAKAIVESHGGKLILAESRPGRTVFEMSIPALEAPRSPQADQRISSVVRM